MTLETNLGLSSLGWNLISFKFLGLLWITLWNVAYVKTHGGCKKADASPQASSTQHERLCAAPRGSMASAKTGKNDFGRLENPALNIWHYWWQRVGKKWKARWKAQSKKKCAIQFYSSIKKRERAVHSCWEGRPKLLVSLPPPADIYRVTYKQHLHKWVKLQFTPLSQSRQLSCICCFLILRWGTRDVYASPVGNLAQSQASGLQRVWTACYNSNKSLQVEEELPY